ncbi:MAG: glutathione S-transferase family protein [Alphaproteobacteria bacterium]|nr:glutathione S-transferase family protein [Alphaproteobacteria bacterium]
MKLYFAPRTRSLRAFWILEEAGQPYEKEQVDFRAGKQSTPAYHAINPMEKVPALTDGEAAVAEVAAICAYVAERYPEAGLAPPPGDPKRGRYLQWLFFHASIEAAFVQKVAKFEMSPADAGLGDFDRVFNAVEETLAQGGPWILGERFSAADVMIGGDLYFGSEGLKILSLTPASAAYVARCKDRPAFQRARVLNQTGA